MNLKGRSFLTLKDFTPEEIIGLLDLAAEIADMLFGPNQPFQYLVGHFLAVHTAII